MDKSKDAPSITLVVIGGGLKNDQGVWRTTNLDEGDAYGPLGDRLRVEAAASLYAALTAKSKAVTIFAIGGVGRSKELGHPTVSSVLKKELQALGVPENKITTEEESATTFQQLRAIQDALFRFDESHLLLISNRFHLPRIEAMMTHIQQLSGVLERLKKESIYLVAAEDILIANNPNQWKGIVEDAYASAYMRQRIALEEKGIAELRTGTYHFE